MSLVNRQLDLLQMWRGHFGRAIGHALALQWLGLLLEIFMLRLQMACKEDGVEDEAEIFLEQAIVSSSPHIRRHGVMLMLEAPVLEVVFQRDTDESRRCHGGIHRHQSIGQRDQGESDAVVGIGLHVHFQVV